MNITQEINKALKILITDCKSVLKNTDSYADVSNEDFVRLKLSISNIVKRVCGDNSPHYREIIEISRHDFVNSYALQNYLGALKAAKFDLDNGLLFDIKLLVSAEVVGEFIDQAEFLLQQGYFHPAASLAGAVLEDALRKLSTSNAINVPDKTKIDTLNIALVKKGVYNTLVQKQITAYADIRNNADHGHFDKFNSKDVEEMIGWVRRFVSEYLK